MDGLTTRRAERRDEPLLSGVLERANASGIPATGTVIEEKLWGADAAAEPETIVVELSDTIAGFVTVSGSVIRLIAVDPERQGRGIGRRLLDLAMTRIATGSERVTVGGAAGNYLVPGVSTEDERTLEFFLQQGFTRDEEDAIDLIVSLPAPELSPSKGPVVVRRCDAQDRVRTLEFIEKRFARGWAWEVALGFDRDDPTCLIAIEEDRILGFSGWELNNRGLGTFGPQGVDPAARGRGIGRRLLLATLEQLAREGFPQARIPWVSSVEYYRKNCGARVAARYAQLSRALSEES